MCSDIARELEARNTELAAEHANKKTLLERLNHLENEKHVIITEKQKVELSVSDLDQQLRKLQREIAQYGDLLGESGRKRVRPSPSTAVVQEPSPTVTATTTTTQTATVARAHATRKTREL